MQPNKHQKSQCSRININVSTKIYYKKVRRDILQWKDCIMLYKCLWYYPGCHLFEGQDLINSTVLRGRSLRRYLNKLQIFCHRKCFMFECLCITLKQIYVGLNLTCDLVRVVQSLVSRSSHLHTSLCREPPWPMTLKIRSTLLMTCRSGSLSSPRRPAASLDERNEWDLKWVSLPLSPDIVTCAMFNSLCVWYANVCSSSRTFKLMFVFICDPHTYKTEMLWQKASWS